MLPKTTISNFIIAFPLLWVKGNIKNYVIIMNVYAFVKVIVTSEKLCEPHVCRHLVNIIITLYINNA